MQWEAYLVWLKGETESLLWISMFHRAFFNSIIDKHQHMHFLIQHYISLECWFH